jgi:glycerophosphoryl diester phosphodiesterase
MWVIAHRGASAVAPENTLAAFGRALEMGAGFIETDLQLSRDARLVAIHDPDLDRTTNGHGLVSSKNLEELRQLDAGEWFDRRQRSGPAATGGTDFAGHRIPTIEEVLAFGGQHDIGLYLELKPRGPSGVEHAIVGALRAANEIVRSVVISFDLATLAHLRRLESLLMTGYLCTKTGDVVTQAVKVGARQLLPRADRATPELVREAHSADLKVVVWTVDDPGQMLTFLAAGVDGIITDHPDRLVKLLAADAKG